MTSTRRFDPTKAVAAVCSAAVPAAAAVALRNHYDWQETAAILDLVAACTVAGVLAGGIGALWERSTFSTIRWAFAGAALVVPLLVLYYIVLMWTTVDHS
jgi:glucose-6-phosphate-specific signal transduction histidine kinase